MAILVTDDFTSTVVKEKVRAEQDYITDDLVNVHWVNIAKQFGVPVANLPTAPNEEVKQVLILCVMMHVASDSIGSVMKQLAEGVVVDEWERRYNTWKERKEMLMGQLSSEDIYDPLNPPDEIGERSSSVLEWDRR